MSDKEKFETLLDIIDNKSKVLATLDNTESTEELLVRFAQNRVITEILEEFAKKLEN